ncbi:SAM-dependent methyltransferase [Spirillospora sp. CA-294931]|uniref:SAM-dependent methyltransferase n=1 Tax=Spirillospora sp. CA-294931 TaxID=3240042 RepID=UPI003D8EEE55
MYDYWLRGRDHFAADRALAEKLISLAREGGPNPRLGARANRAFLGRAVRLAADAGVRQFLDFGTGLPAMGNVHEVAREVHPEARVVYVDHDPVVCAHGRATLVGDDAARMVRGDIRDMPSLLRHPGVTDLIDFSEPVAVLFVAVLHYLADEDDPHGVVALIKDRMVPGSHLVLSHMSGDPDPDHIGRGTRHFARSNAPQHLRPIDDIRRFFDGLDLVEPGLVSVPLWRPDGDVPEFAARFPMQAGVGRK